MLKALLTAFDGLVILTTALVVAPDLWTMVPDEWSRPGADRLGVIFMTGATILYTVERIARRYGFSVISDVPLNVSDRKDDAQ